MSNPLTSAVIEPLRDGLLSLGTLGMLAWIVLKILAIAGVIGCEESKTTASTRRLLLESATFDPPFPNHSLMHGAGRFGLASLCNLDQLPPTGAIVIAAPLKIVGGSGSPVRAMALVPQ